MGCNNHGRNSPRSTVELVSPMPCYWVNPIVMEYYLVILGMAIIKLFVDYCWWISPTPHHFNQTRLEEKPDQSLLTLPKGQTAVFAAKRDLATTLAAVIVKRDIASEKKKLEQGRSKTQKDLNDFDEDLFPCKPWCHQGCTSNNGEQSKGHPEWNDPGSKDVWGGLAHEACQNTWMLSWDYNDMLTPHAMSPAIGIACSNPRKQLGDLHRSWSLGYRSCRYHVSRFERLRSGGPHGQLVANIMVDSG